VCVLISYENTRLEIRPPISDPPISLFHSAFSTFHNASFFRFLVVAAKIHHRARRRSFLKESRKRRRRRDGRTRTTKKKKKRRTNSYDFEFRNRLSSECLRLARIPDKTSPGYRYRINYYENRSGRNRVGLARRFRFPGHAFLVLFSRSKRVRCL